MRRVRQWRMCCWPWLQWWGWSRMLVKVSRLECWQGSLTTLVSNSRLQWSSHSRVVMERRAVRAAEWVTRVVEELRDLQDVCLVIHAVLGGLRYEIIMLLWIYLKSKSTSASGLYNFYWKKERFELFNTKHQMLLLTTPRVLGWWMS